MTKAPSLQLQEMTTSMDRFQKRTLATPLMDRHTAFSIGLLTFGISDFLLTFNLLKRKCNFLNYTLEPLNDRPHPPWDHESMPLPFSGILMRLAMLLHGIGILTFPALMIIGWWMVHEGRIALFAPHAHLGLFSYLLHGATALTTLGGAAFMFLAWRQARQMDRLKHDCSEAWGEAWPNDWRVSAAALQSYDGPLFKWMLITTLFTVANLIFVIRLFDQLFIPEQWQHLEGPMMLFQALSIPVLIVLLTATVFILFHTVLGMIRRYLWDKDLRLSDPGWNWRFSLPVLLWMATVFLSPGSAP